jgi:SAM-dependent methyltransferase
MSHEKLSVVGAQDRINGDLYDRRDLVQEYLATNLYPPEAMALVRYREDIVQRRLLDLGCGAGRLAAYLRPLTDHYVGLDISAHMVSHCQRQYPELRFLQGDMRDLTRFGAASFDAVFAIFNLFDAVSHEDRLRIFAEVRRVLTPGGLLVFSSHNRNYAHAADPPRLQFRRSPLTLLRGVAEYLQARANHRRIKPQQRSETEYAILNDSGHTYAVLHYYISRVAQIRQLDAVGFRVLECLDEFGRTLQPGDKDSAYSSIHYLARPAS